MKNVKKILLLLFLIISFGANAQKNELTFFPTTNPPKVKGESHNICLGDWGRVAADFYNPYMLLAVIYHTDNTSKIGLTLSDNFIFIKHKRIVESGLEGVFSDVYEEYPLKVVLNYDGKKNTSSGQGSGGYFEVYNEGVLITKLKFYWTM